MLPKLLTTDLCSLRGNVERLAFSVTLFPINSPYSLFALSYCLFTFPYSLISFRFSLCTIPQSPIPEPKLLTTDRCSLRGDVVFSAMNPSAFERRGDPLRFKGCKDPYLELRP